MADSSQFPVHLGLWTNWSNGAVFGSTLTLTQRDANLAIAFAAFFISFVGSRFWRILCLVLHFTLSTAGEPQDALHHQRQAILRNTASPEAGAFDLIMMAWAWRRRAQRLHRRTLPLIVLSTVIMAAWVVAGGFSSRISFSDMENEVLISGTGCGWLNPSRDSNLTHVMMRLYPDLADQLSAAATYAQQCYRGTSSPSSDPAQTQTKNPGVLDCATFVETRIPSTIDRKAPCPFKGDICKSKTGNLVVDTGLIDSHAQFGLNSRPEDRFSFRHRLSCAPLKTEGFSSIFNTSRERSQTRYHYGPLSGQSGTNVTYVYSNDKFADKQAAQGAQGFWTAHPDYSLRVITANSWNGSVLPPMSDFAPIPELLPPDEPMTADIMLIFLSANDIQYSAAIKDPWYSANRDLGQVAFLNPVAELMNQTHAIYGADEAASPLGCTRQVQFCNAAGVCGPMAGTFDYPGVANSSGLFPTEAAFKRFDWTYTAVWGRTIGVDYVAGTLGSRSLLSRNGLTMGTQGPLPDDQWQEDVQHWQNTAMAALQSLFLQAAAGPMSEGMRPWFEGPTTDLEREICTSQKIKTKAYASFSMFGIYTILVVGVLITVTSWVLEPILGCLHRRTGHREHQLLEWAATGTLQLQRMAHEQVNSGRWEKGSAMVPVTSPGDLLSGLDLSHAGHPRLQLQGGEWGKWERREKGMMHGPGGSAGCEGGPRRLNTYTGHRTENLESAKNKEYDTRTAANPDAWRRHQFDKEEKVEAEVKDDVRVLSRSFSEETFVSSLSPTISPRAG